MSSVILIGLTSLHMNEASFFLSSSCFFKIFKYNIRIQNICWQPYYAVFSHIYAGSFTSVKSPWKDCYGFKLLKAPTHHPDSNQQPTAYIWPLRCLLSDPFGRKVALNTPLWRAANSTEACTFCACMRCNKWVVLVLCLKKTLVERFMHATLLLSKT